MDTTTPLSEPVIFKPNYGLSISYILLAPFFGFMTYILLTILFSQNQIIAGSIGLITTLLILGFFYATLDTIYVTKEGIRSKSKLSERMIVWDDIISISSLTDWNNTFGYTIKITLRCPLKEFGHDERIFFGMNAHGI